MQYIVNKETVVFDCKAGKVVFLANISTGRASFAYKVRALCYFVTISGHTCKKCNISIGLTRKLKMMIYFLKQDFRFPKQELLVYKCISLDNTLQSSSNGVDFQLVWKRSFANPLFAIEYLDLTNDGLKEIAVASLSGLHVLQVSNFVTAHRNLQFSADCEKLITSDYPFVPNSSLRVMVINNLLN